MLIFDNQMLTDGENIEVSKSGMLQVGDMKFDFESLIKTEKIKKPDQTFDPQKTM